MFKSAYIAIIGEPNVGKSTLLNAILGTHLSIVAPKPQTTRKSVTGILNTDDAQLVFLDTAGILEPAYELQRAMMGAVRGALDDADIILLVIDVTSKQTAEEQAAHAEKFLKKATQPKILVLSKVDKLRDKGELLPLIEMLSGHALGFKEIIPIAAPVGDGIKNVVDTLLALAPEGVRYFDANDISNQDTRFFSSELVREAIFKQFREEVPYACEVVITEFLEREKTKWRIKADIIVERDSQKGILIGAGGAALKEIGMRSRIAIEAFTGAEIFLELFVRVQKDWREDKAKLREMGY